MMYYITLPGTRLLSSSEGAIEGVDMPCGAYVSKIIQLDCLNFYERNHEVLLYPDNRKSTHSKAKRRQPN